MRRIENSSSLNTSISMKLDQKREKGTKKWADLCKGVAGEPSRVFSIRVRRYSKNLEISMTCIFFSISNGKPEIVKVLHKT